jgi:hypothetical protein
LLLMPLPALSPPGALGSVLEPLLMPGVLPDIEEPEAVLAGAVLLVPASGAIAPAGAGAGATAGEVVEVSVDGLLIEVVLLVEGSVLSALWQAESASAANTGTSSVVVFMMCPFQ